MQTPSKQDREALAKYFAYKRRFYNRIWLGMAVVFALAGAIVWLFTGNIENLYGGIFYTIFPLLGWFQNHFIHFNPRRDPIETNQRLKLIDAKIRKSVRSSSFANGVLLMATSPIFFVLGIGSGGAEYGVAGAILGGLFGLLWFAAGLAGVMWSNE